MKDNQKDRERAYSIMVVDDNEENVAILEARLQSQKYSTMAAYDGVEALEKAEKEMPDLILLDVMMPKMDGFEVCRRLKVNPTTRMIPVIMVTAKTDAEDIAHGLETGADDYLTKPYNQMELMARVRSMLRIRQAYLDIAELNRTLEQRVREQVLELQRVGRLKRYFSPQLLKSLTSDEAEAVMQSHRREITVAFLDLRGFTSFSERSEPEEVMAVLGEFHRTAGSIIFQHEGTIERFAGDGIMVFFGDPMPIEDHPCRAIRMALDLQEEFRGLSNRWKKMGFDLSLGIGISTGYATLGTIGFEGRLDYAAIGNVTNLAARLCEKAKGEQILISRRTRLMAEEAFKTKPLGDIDIRGFSTPVPIYEVLTPIQSG